MDLGVFKRSLAISMAFIGVIVGAGFASGQEAMQYFVAFGNMGIVGAISSAWLMVAAGIAFLQLGSYFQADEHTAVYDQVAGPITSKILDWSTLATLFSVGFVMFAGGGANLNQQFPAIPVWAGATLMLVLVLVVGLLDVDRVTAVIGTITPFIILFTVLAAGYTIFTTDVNFTLFNSYAVDNVASPLPYWWLAALNYTGLNAICAVSMAIVIGGNFFNNREVAIGGVFAGIIYITLLMMLVFSLYFVAADVNGTDMPILELINGINPMLGYAMTFVIFGMIFNTAIGMFYAMGRRLTRRKPENFYRVYASAAVIGFCLSFVGFQQLVSFIYPILGYLGLLLIAVTVFAWLRNRGTMTTEAKRRSRARTLVSRKLDPRERFTKRNEVELAKLAEASNMEPDEFEEAVSEEIYEELEADEELEDFDRENPDPSVTYVQHTEPVVPTDDNMPDLDFGEPKGPVTEERAAGTGDAPIIAAQVKRPHIPTKKAAENPEG